MDFLRHIIGGWARIRAWSHAERAAGAACAMVGLALLAWAWRLWPEWRINPELSHGFFAVPVVVLLWRRAMEDAERGLGGVGQKIAAAAAGLVVLAGVFFATVYVGALGWADRPTLFLLGATLAAAVGAASVLAAGKDVRWIGAGWPVLVIPAVIVLSGPLPPGTYAKLTLALQEMITIGVVETLRLVGIPAMRAGMVINLGTTSVGVEEACSGVRSLVSCVLSGLVLSALLPRSAGRRALLVLLAAPLALLMNFARSLTLTLLAKNGVDIAGAWHDGLGFAVLGVTTGLLAWVAFSLEEGPAVTPGNGSAAVFAGRREASGWGAQAWVLGCLGMAAGWMVFVAVRTQSEVGRAVAAPELARIIPERPTGGGWEVATRRDLDRFAGILLTEDFLERTYVRREANGETTQVTVYAAWWPAGAISVSAVASHTPEACWPGTGWEMEPDAGGRVALPMADGRYLAEAEERVFRRGKYPQRVWFWHLVAGEAIRPFDPLSFRVHLKRFWSDGVRPESPQVFVRMSSNREWRELADESLIAEVLAGFEELGVPVRRL